MGDQRRRAGSRATLESLLVHQEFLRALARALVGDEHRAEEVVQETWVAALERPPAPGWNPRAWLGGVARNLARRRFREERRRRAREGAVARTDRVRPTGEIVAREAVRRRVVDAVLSLPEPYRTAVLLRYYDDLPPRDIAAQLDLPGATVRSHLRRGLERLRDRLDAEHGGDRRAWALPLLALLPLTKRAAAAAAGGLAMTAKTGKIAALAPLLAVAATGLLWSVLASRDGERGGSRAGREANAAPAPATGSEQTPRETRNHAPAPDQEPAAPAPRGPVVLVVASADPGARGIGRGVEVLVVHDDGRSARGVTDPRGRAAFLEELAGLATVWVSSPDRGRQRFESVALRAGEETRVVLLAGAAISLRFLAPSGEPLAGAEARRLFEEAGIPATVRVFPEEVLSGAIGRTLLGRPETWHHDVPFSWTAGGAELAEPLTAGIWRLFAMRPGATPYLTGTLTVEAGRPLRIDLPLGPARATRRVRFVADETGEPLAGATLRAWAEYGDDQAFLPGIARRTDGGGEVEIPLHGMENGQLDRPPSWWLTTPTHAALVNEYKLRRDAAGSVQEIRVKRRASIQGRAYLDTGEPAAGCEVLFSRKGYTVRGRVGADGSFRLDGVPCLSGRARILLVEDVSEPRFRTETTEIAPGGTAEVVFGSPEPGAVFQGRITSGGRGVEGLFVLLRLRQEEGRFKRRYTTTDAEGRFRIAGIGQAKSASHKILLGDPRASDDFGLASVEKWAPRPGAAKRIEIDLPAGAIAVRVLDVDGKPVAGAVAGARIENREAAANLFPGYSFRAGWAVFTDAKGAALLRCLPPGEPYTVSVRAKGYERARLERRLPGPAERPAAIEVRLRAKER